MDSIFSKIKKQDLFELIDQCDGFQSVDREDIYKEYQVHVENHLKKDRIKSKIQDLEDKWYFSLNGLSPAYSIYNHPYYLCDIWLCWLKYSRVGLRELNNPRSLNGKSVVQYCGSPGVVLDLGCGFGYTSAALKELFPSARVIATNLKESYQYQVAERIGKQRGFEVREGIDGLSNVDIVYASEYFEHLTRPVEHLHELITKVKPRTLFIANGFNGRAIGHFNHYQHLDKTLTAKEMNAFFYKSLKTMGYSKLKTKIWNNRPSVWIRN